jgi:YHS domain-containing protein
MCEAIAAVPPRRVVEFRVGKPYNTRMIRLVVFAVLVLALVWAIQSYFPGKGTKDEDDSEMVLDPNCNTYVLKKTAVTRNIAERTYHFCGDRCADEFAAKKKT